MTLLRRRPREIYRVYSEEEYLDGAGSAFAIAGESPVDEPSPRVTGPARQAVLERRLHRVAGVAVLAGTIGAVAGLVCLNIVRAHHGAGAAGRGDLVAATHAARTASSLPAVEEAQSQAGPSSSSRPVIVRTVETARSHAEPRLARSHIGGTAPHRSDGLPAGHPARQPASRIAVLAADAHRAPSSNSASATPGSAPVSSPAPVPASAPTPTPSQASSSASARSAPEEVSTTTTAVSAPPAHPAPETQAEFGFER
jgi:hypothetical protein